MKEVFGAWVGLGWRDPLLWKRTALKLGLVLGSVAGALGLGHGLPWILLMVLGGWPWRFRLSVGEADIDCRWLFARQVLPLSDIRSVRLEVAARRWLPWRRRALVLERRAASAVRVLAPASTLGALEVAIRAGLARQ